MQLFIILFLPSGRGKKLIFDIMTLDFKPLISKLFILDAPITVIHSILFGRNNVYKYKVNSHLKKIFLSSSFTFFLLHLPLPKFSKFFKYSYSFYFIAMAPPVLNIDYNSPNFKFLNPQDSAPCYKLGLISKELLPIRENQPRLVIFKIFKFL